MATAATAPADLEIEPPDVVRCGANTYRCGGITYRILRHMTRARKGASTVRDLAAAVWGEKVGAEVGRNTVKVALSRVNDVLAGIGAREKVTIDGAAVLLL
jgi:hypothetical protein